MNQFDELAQRALKIFPRSRHSAEARLAIPGGEVRIGLDVRNSSKSKSHTTRVAASYENTHDFEFVCGSNTPLQKVFTFLGAQDVTVGHAEFDKAFVVRSNDPEKVITLFADGGLRDLFLQAHDDQWLTVQSHAAENPSVSPLLGCRHEVVWTCAGIETDARRLAARAELVARVIWRLCEIGEAKCDDGAR